jgi:hypothetical protein
MAVTRERSPTTDAPTQGGPSLRRIAGALAGPALIVGSVLVVLRGFAFGGMVSAQHTDPLAVWLPFHCFLGTSLAAGHIPAWNPYTMGGVPFAADPQSGWMYLPAMVLYAALPCDAAIRWFIVLQPILAGVALHWFLRDQGLSRTASTVGGLLLAMVIANTRLALALPFAGALTWSAVLLACASRYFGARTWAGRLVWGALVATAWGQVAAAHMSHGLVLATGILAAYATARLIREVRDGRVTRGQALASSALLVAALPLLNLAFFLPRLAYLPRTSLAQGYEHLAELRAQFLGVAPHPYPPGFSTGAAWPLTLATSPGAYLGAAALALSFAGWWLRRYRHLLTAFAAFGGVCYLLSLRGTAEILAPVARNLPRGDFYLHEPARFRYGLLLAAAVVVPFGVEAWRRSTGARDRALMVAPGAAVFGLLPLAVGAPVSRLALLAGGAVAGGAVLAASVRRPALAAALPVVLAVELMVGGLLGQAQPTEFLVTGIVPPRARSPLTPLLDPDIDAKAYTQGGRIAGALRTTDAVRYLSLDPFRSENRGHLLNQRPEDWALMANHRSVLFRVEEAQGYNPVQLMRFWMFVRAAEYKPIRYNAAVFEYPNPEILDMLQVGLVVGPSDYPILGDVVPVTEEGRWTLYRRQTVPPRASVITSWQVVPSPGHALAAVVDGEFDPSALAILESDPFPRPGPGGEPQEEPTGPTRPGRAVYRWFGPQAARVVVDAPASAVLLVRNAWDPGWHATVDGRPAPVLKADYLLQAVPVPPGRHTVLLEYDDPWIGYGLLGSGIALGTLLLLALVLRRRERPGRVSPESMT